MLKKGINLLSIYFFLVLTSCSVNYKLNEDEKYILSYTSEHLKQGIISENTLKNNSNKLIWDEIQEGGNRPSDIKVGIKADSLIARSKLYLRPLDSIVRIAEKEQDVNLTPNILNHFCSLRNKLFTDNQLNDYNKEFRKSFINSAITSNSTQFQNELGLKFLNPMGPEFQKLTLLSFEHLVAFYIRKEMQEISSEVGSDCFACFQTVGVCISPDYEIVEKDSIVTCKIVLSEINGCKNYPNLIFNGNEIERKFDQWKLKIPILAQPKGPNKYHLLVKSKYHNQEVVDTLTGYFVVR